MNLAKSLESDRTTLQEDIVKKFLIAGLVAALASTSIVAPAYADNEGAGTIIGGLIGGIIGNQFGKGNGKVGATIIGAVIGGAIGNKIGRDMDKAERRAWSRAHRRALDGNLNERYSWDGRSEGGRNGYRGEYVTVREGYHVETRQVCREYRSVIYDRYGNKDVYSGYSCRTETTWTEVESTYVVFRPVQSSRSVSCRVTNARGETFSARGSNRTVALEKAMNKCFDISRFCEGVEAWEWNDGYGPDARTYRRCNMN